MFWHLGTNGAKDFYLFNFNLDLNYRHHQFGLSIFENDDCNAIKLKLIIIKV